MPRSRELHGQQGDLILRPAPGGPGYGAVAKFRSHADWTAFQEWPEYREFLAEIRPHLEVES